MACPCNQTLKGDGMGRGQGEVRNESKGRPCTGIGTGAPMHAGKAHALPARSRVDSGQEQRVWASSLGHEGRSQVSERARDRAGAPPAPECHSYRTRSHRRGDCAHLLQTWWGGQEGPHISGPPGTPRAPWCTRTCQPPAALLFPGTVFRSTPGRKRRPACGRPAPCLLVHQAESSASLLCRLVLHLSRVSCLTVNLKNRR